MRQPQARVPAAGRAGARRWTPTRAHWKRCSWLWSRCCRCSGAGGRPLCSSRSGRRWRGCAAGPSRASTSRRSSTCSLVRIFFERMGSGASPVLAVWEVSLLVSLLGCSPPCRYPDTSCVPAHLASVDWYLRQSPTRPRPIFLRCLTLLFVVHARTHPPTHQPPKPCLALSADAYKLSSKTDARPNRGGYRLRDLLIEIGPCPAAGSAEDERDGAPKQGTAGAADGGAAANGGEGCASSSSGTRNGHSSSGSGGRGRSSGDGAGGGGGEALSARRREVFRRLLATARAK